MKVNLNLGVVKNYSKTRVVNNGVNYSKNNYDLFANNYDTVSFSGVKGKLFDKKSVTEIYDRAYQTVLAETIEENPFMKDVKIAKPKFSYDEENCPTSIAAYSPQNNTVYFNAATFQRFNDKIATAMMREDDGSVTFYKKFLNDDEINQLIEDGKSYGVEVEPFVMSDEEKKLYVESFFAHELRHAMQTHFQLSTEGIHSQTIKEFQERKEMVDFYKSLGVISKDDPQFAITFDYILGYKPKKMLSQDEKFASSGLYKGQKIFWSASDFTEAGVANEGDTRAYMTRPNEIDAYKFECDYVTNKVKSNPDKYSKDFLSFYLAEKQPRYEYGLEARGY